MSNVFTSSGTTYEVSAAEPATYDQVGFEALSYTTVGEVTDLPEFGAQYAAVEHKPLATRNTVKRKGTKNDGSMSIQLGKDLTDAGQVLMESGADGANKDVIYSHKITDQNGNVYFFTAQIYSYTTNIGAADQIVGSMAQVEIDNTVVVVAA